MKNFITVCLFAALLPASAFSQDSTAITKDSTAVQTPADSLVKCRVCGFANKITNVNCEACGASLTAGKMSDSTIAPPVDTTLKKGVVRKDETSLGIKFYLPMEKEVFVQGGNPFPFTSGFGANLNVEHINKFGAGWGLDVGYYETSNFTTLVFYDQFDNSVDVRVEFGYKGVKIHPSYKWKDPKMPFWTSIGCPIWFGKIFMSAVDYEGTYSSLSLAGIGGAFFVGTDINVCKLIFLTPQAGIQLISIKSTDPEYQIKSTLLSIQMMLGINFRL